ncbi:MAG: ankyrin repeat domain-containing protein [Acidobacteriota bacterium]
MPKKQNMKDIGYAFRHALTTDRDEAGRLLKDHPELIDYPVFGDSESALHFFAVESQVEIVRWLLSHRANPDGIAEDDSPLHGAAQLGHEAVCRDLLAAGADPNRVDSLGETALHKASAYGYTAIIQLLLDSGADPSIPEMFGELPVDQALPRKRDEVRAVFDRHRSARPARA